MGLALFVAGVVGCVAPTVEAEPPLVVWHAYRGQEEIALVEAAEAWGEEQGVTVETVALPFGAFDSKLETAIPRGNGPDLFVAAHSGLGKWVAMDLLEPVPTHPDDQLGVSLEALTWDATLWAEPLAYKSLLLLYDPARVQSVPKTTSALIEQARSFTENGAFGLVYQASEPYYHGAWMHAFGAPLIDAQGAVSLDSEAHVAGYAFTKRLALDEKITPLQPTAELVSTLYREGKAAFVISGPWFVADMDRPVAAAPLPLVDEAGGPAKPYLTVEGAFVAKHAGSRQRAHQLARYLSSSEGARVRQEVGQQAVSYVHLSSDDPLLRAMADQAANSVPLPAHPNTATAFEAQARALQSLLRGSATPSAAAQSAQRAYETMTRPVAGVSPRPYIVALVVSLCLMGLWLLWPLREAATRSSIRRHFSDYLWIFPAALSLILLVVVPFCTGAFVAFFAHDQGTWTFVGLQHFLDILLSRDWPVTSPLSFFFTLGVTVLWTLTNVALHVGIGLALAMLLREPWIRLRGMWRALLIVPWAIPNYITALIWKGMFHAQYGAINAILGVVTLSDGPVALDWFGSFFTAFAANLVTNTWLGFPFMMVVALGSLQAIPRELEEAAEVDGAGMWFRFRHVVLPLLVPALLPAVILGSVWTFNMFNVVYLVSAGEPNSSTEILISEAYRWAFTRGNRYGYAAAYAVLIFGVLLMYSKGINRLAGRRIL